MTNDATPRGARATPRGAPQIPGVLLAEQIRHELGILARGLRQGLEEREAVACLSLLGPAPHPGRDAEKREQPHRARRQEEHQSQVL